MGAVLLSVSLAGDFTSAGRYEDAPPRPWERFDAMLAARTPDLPSLLRAAQERAGGTFDGLPPTEAMQTLYETVADRFTHGDRAKYNVFSNWILWSLGAVRPRYRFIQDPDALLRNGHSAMCGEISFILVRLALMAGIPARHVHLNGHIVMESWFDGAWHAFDPDLEETVRDETGNILSVAKAALRPDLLRERYATRGSSAYLDELLAIYTNTQDDSYLVFPQKSFFAPNGHWPGRIEQVAVYARIGVPLAFLTAGFLLLRFGRRREGEKT